MITRKLTNRIQNEERITTLCDHCGNESHKESVGSHFTLMDGIGFDYHMYICSICVKIFLFTITDGNIAEQTWPDNKLFPEVVPPRIREIYREALLVKRRSPTSYAVQLGRALEAMCSEKNATGRGLFNQINFRITEGILPGNFGDLVEITRMFRNWGAHDAEHDVETADVEMIDEFFRAVIEYVYIAPAKVERAQELMNERRIGQ